MPDKPLPVVIVEVSISRQWGDEQQKSLDSAVYWHAQAQPEEIAEIESSLRKFLSQIELGTFRNQLKKENR